MIEALASNPLDVTTYLDFGVLGLIVLSLISGFLWTKPSVDRLTEDKMRAIKDKERAEAQRDEMARVLQDRLLPVVGDFVTTTRALVPVLQQLQQLQQLQSLIPILQELVRASEIHPPLPPEPEHRKPRRPTH